MTAPASVPAQDGTTTAPLALHDVTLVRGDGESTVTALDTVNLEVAAGEFVAVVGPSGSGKSSLLAVAGGLQRPTSGTVHVAGTDLGALSDRRRTALRLHAIGFVFQQANLFSSLTVREQLLLPAHLDGEAGGDARRRADELIEAVGLTARAGRRPHQLSGGERQRVGLARALMLRPAVLLIDEPTSALDHARSQEVVDLLAAQTRERNTATVMVTHDTSILDRADRVLEMRDGALT